MPQTERIKTRPKDGSPTSKRRAEINKFNRRAFRYHLTCFSSQPPDVRTGGGDPQMNRFEQVPSFGQKMPLTGEKRVGTCTERPGQGPVQKGVFIRKR